MVTPGAASPYVTMFQSRRSLLAWKVFGRRLDGWSDDDFPSITKIGDLTSLTRGGKPIEKLDYSDEKALSDYLRDRAVDMDFTGSIMPPPKAVREAKVKPLTDEDRRTIVRWIDLGCPIDVDPQYDPSNPGSRSYGWMGDDQRPTLTLTSPEAGENEKLTRLLVGMADAYTGIDTASFTVTADFEIDGVKPGENLADRFTPAGDGIAAYTLRRPVSALKRGVVTVSIRDRQGNVSRVERAFSVK
jgi:hypothetical protein